MAGKGYFRFGERESLFEKVTFAEAWVNKEVIPAGVTRNLGNSRSKREPEAWQTLASLQAHLARLCGP